MSLGACLPPLVESGALSKERAAKIQNKFDQLLGFYRGQMGEAAAAARATERTIDQLAHEAALKRQRAGLAVEAQILMRRKADSFAGAKKGGPILQRAAAAILVHDDKAPYLSLEYLWGAVRRRAHAGLDQILLRHRNDLLGRTRDKAGFDRMIDELHGDKTGDLNAAEMADGARQVKDMLRKRANAAGADIGELENHGLPHNHHSGKVEDAGYDEWSAFLKPKLDRLRMQDRDTGLPFTDAKLDALLKDMYRAVVTDGWSRREPGSIGASSIASQMGQERFLHFKSGAEWRAYHDRFGAGTIYDALMNHVDRMSRNIAMMETLGPNPGAGLKWLQDSVEKTAAEVGTRADREGASKSVKKLQTLYDEIIGKNRQPYSRKVAQVFSAVRSWQTASKLGSATLSATSDVATQQLTRAFDGLPQTGVIRGYLKYMNPLDVEDRAAAIRAGVGADDYARSASTQGRFLSEELVGEVPRRVAESVLRISGLNAVTEGGRFLFGTDFFGALAHFSSRPFDALDAPFRRMLDRHGFDAAAWDKVRATPLSEERGTTWLRPIDIKDVRLGDKVLGMIQAETDFAVPVGGIEVSAMVNSAFKPGTLLGELGRTAFQFKSFSATVTMMHARRMMALSSWKGRAGYFVGMVALTTIAGALALQMKEIAKGRDPRPMDDWQFWAASQFQGGGLGIYGDFLKSSESRFGQSFSDVLKGPAWQTADTLNSLTLDAAWDAADPNTDVNYGARVTRALKSELPGSSLWYTRLAFDRLLIDHLQEMIDPNYQQSRSRMEKAAKDQGTQFFWKPGELAPDRAPDFTNALGNQGSPQ